MCNYRCNYDAWKTGAYESSYERDPDAEYVERQPSHMSIKELRYLQESFAEVVKQLYMKAPINLATLDDDLNYLARELGVDIPDHQPTVQRKNNHIFNLAMDLSKLQAFGS